MNTSTRTFRLSRISRGWLPAFTLPLALLAACGGSGLDPILGTPSVARAPMVSATTPISATPSVTGVASTVRPTVTFDRAMTASSITPTSFSLACPAGAPVTAAVSYDAATRTATLTPAAALPASTTCVANVSTAVLDSTGFAMVSPYTWSFVTAQAVDTTRPTVTFGVPANGTTGVATNTVITASFSEAMAPATLSDTSFTVVNTTLNTPVAGTVSYSAAARTATFTPTAPGGLPSSTVYTVTLSTALTDVAGNALAGNTAVAPAAGAEVWSFTTSAAADTTRPTVTFGVPANGSTGVATNTLITASFSEAMAPATLSATSFTVVNTTLNTPVAGTVSYSAAARTATFTPTAPTGLAASTVYRATLSTAVTDVAGNALAGNTAVLPAAGPEVWSFTTSAAADTTAPTVTAISPADGSTGTCLSTPVSATFSEPMDPATVTPANFGVTAGGTAVTGIVSYDAPTRVATFTPSNTAGFSPSTALVVTVRSGATGVRDLAGNPLATDRVWNFTTGTQPCLGSSINLATAAAYGAFGGGAGVTNQGVNTVIGGNLGTTAACTLVTGLHDASNVYTETPLNIGVVNGSIQCGPPAPGTTTSLDVATQARADAQTAYNTLAALPPNPTAGQLGGLTLAPGVYTAAGGTFDITSGDLVLDAQGNAGAVWVFQSAAALTVGLPATVRSVRLINGAQAKNVWWQVGSAARINDGSTMVGTIIAPAGVTVSTAGQTVQTTLIGRAIGLTASVTLVNTTIVAP
ncbi:MAG: Ig-like domain-containing protein [Rubrivivax sp.]|nr:Ig-like domain-containing protein [Rubrivivax sp.]